MNKLTRSEPVKIMLDHSAGRTMLILGAVLSGGDYMKLAKQLVQNDKNEEKQ